ncbi:glycyl radical protein [bacterium]|nr:glycyl radical protein [bacterium]
MNERVRRLRENSLNTVPYLSPERAILVTDAYAQAGDVSAPMRRALVFRSLMENKVVCIQDSEWIVGERGPAPKATYTYPELTCHSLEDLDVLHHREKTPFQVSEAMRDIYRERIIPYWRGRTMREKIFSHMTPAWRRCYQSGVFTEFMEQRAPGHTVLDDKIYRLGMLDFIKRIDDALLKLDYLHDQTAWQRSEELQAMRICAQAIITLANRYAQEAERLAQQERSLQRQRELKRIAEICRWVPACPPRSFHEALQSYWFVHLGVITELNPWDSFNPGRLDQHLYPFYQSDRAVGALDQEAARELLQCFWIKFNNQPAPPKVGVTAAESATYTDFANINSGGLQADGSDGVNEVTYLILDVIDEMRLLQPSSNIQLSHKNPDAFLRRALQIVAKGWGQPSLFNADAVVAELLRQGKSLVDARNGGTSGCVETGAFGKESYILTGYFNLPKIFEITLNNGRDPRTGETIGLRLDLDWARVSFDELVNAYRAQVNHFVDIKVAGNQIIERLYAAFMPVPFLSILIDDCILTGKDYHDGGARYNSTYIQGVGLGTITDCLSAVKYHVFETKRITMAELLTALQNDFVGDEELRLLLVNRTPRYGNDDDFADALMKQVFELFYQAVEGRKNTKGGEYHIDLLPTTCHVYFGSLTGATADGRKAGKPLSEGISPVQGADRKGPTAVLKSAAKMDHVRTGGTLLNLKFTPSLLQGEKGMNSLGHLVRSYFHLGGHHVQFNVVSAQGLKEAQQHPEQHRDLIVRVAGYSDYFCDLSAPLQNEIIERTEHGSI